MSSLFSVEIKAPGPSYVAKDTVDKEKEYEATARWVNASILSDEEKYDEALSEYMLADDYFKRYEDGDIRLILANDIGKLYLKMDCPDEALEKFDYVLAKAPHNGILSCKARKGRVKAYIANGEMERARAESDYIDSYAEKLIQFVADGDNIIIKNVNTDTLTHEEKDKLTNFLVSMSFAEKAEDVSYLKPNEISFKSIRANNLEMYNQKELEEKKKSLHCKRFYYRDERRLEFEKQQDREERKREKKEEKEKKKKFKVCRRKCKITIKVAQAFCSRLPIYLQPIAFYALDEIEERCIKGCKDGYFISPHHINDFFRYYEEEFINRLSENHWFLVDLKEVTKKIKHLREKHEEHDKNHKR